MHPNTALAASSRWCAPDGIEVQMVNDLPVVNGGWRLPDLAWGAEAWAVLRLGVPAGALPRPAS